MTTRALAAACFAALLAHAAPAAGEGGVAPSAADVKPIEVGTTLPAVELRTREGRAVALSDLTGKKPVVLVFYRGGW